MINVELKSIENYMKKQEMVIEELRDELEDVSGAFVDMYLKYLEKCGELEVEKRRKFQYSHEREYFDIDAGCYKIRKYYTEVEKIGE